MKILLFGKGGQVGWELQRSLSPLGELLALDTGSRDHCGEFTNLSGLAETVRAVAPDVIVNAAAYTAVDKAENEAELARIINAQAVGLLAEEAKRSGALLVHYSTDYVFDGSGERPWLETDVTAPLNVYGASKLEGEQLIMQSGCKHLIFRTCWVYGVRGGNFAKSMLRLAQQRDRLQVINDQIGAPTGAGLLADVTAHAIRSVHRQSELSGLYHLAARGSTSWYHYAKFILEFAEQAGVQLCVAPEAVRAIPSTEFKSAAIRPHNSRLNTDKLQSAFDLYLPDWQIGVAHMLTEVLHGNKEEAIHPQQLLAVHNVRKI